MVLLDFTKATSAANYYFWLCRLQPTIQETPDNKNKGAGVQCNSYEFKDVEFAYPLAPQDRVLKGLSLKVNNMHLDIILQLLIMCAD